MMNRSHPRGFILTSGFGIHNPMDLFPSAPITIEPSEDPLVAREIWLGYFNPPEEPL